MASTTTNPLKSVIIKIISNMLTAKLNSSLSLILDGGANVLFVKNSSCLASGMAHKWIYTSFVGKSVDFISYFSLLICVAGR